MSQTNPQKPIPEPLFKNVELVSGSNHTYKVRTRANDNFSIVYWAKVQSNIRKKILAKIKSTSEEDLSSADPEEISLESVNNWMANHTMADPLFKESFYEVICEPINNAPPITEIFLDIDQEYVREIDAFFTKLGLDGTGFEPEETKSTEDSPKPGKGGRRSSKSRSPRQSSSR